MSGRRAVGMCDTLVVHSGWEGIAVRYGWDGKEGIVANLLYIYPKY